MLSIISAITGIIAIFLCSKRKITWFYFGVIQVTTNLIVSVQSDLTGNIFQNIFSLIIICIGWELWRKNSENNTVQIRKTTKSVVLISTIVFIIGVMGMYFLIRSTDVYPICDSIVFISIVIAQILLLFRYKLQWIFYFIADVAMLYIWIGLGNIPITIQYSIMTINTIYGYLKWSQEK